MLAKTMTTGAEFAPDDGKVADSSTASAITL